MIYGLVKPDSGTMTWRGAEFAPPEPRAARASGVAMVFQHFSLFDALNVAENVALGMENPPPMRDLAAQIRSVSEITACRLIPTGSSGISPPVNANGSRSSAACYRSQLLIMDEPTSV